MKLNRSGEYTTHISDNKILGSFIESGYGRQVPGMWAEVIYNRSFREVPEYKAPTWGWQGIDKDHYGPAAPFWHSGYEEHDWKNVGNPEIYRTLGEETHKGKSSLVLYNKREELCGLTQDGIHLRAGVEYKFRIFCGTAEGRMSNTDISGFGINLRSANPRILEVAIGEYKTQFDVSGEIGLHEWSFAAEKDEVCSLSLTFCWKGDLILAFTSLMPSDNIRGWRKDVVELIREAGPTVVRFPGGCFVSFFDWKTGVGPRDEREPTESYYWGGLEENDVGLAEFMDLAELCNFEAQICFNMMTASPFDARCMVEYLNAPADVGYGRLRMLDGHEKPWNVRYFECDNEVYRKWNPIQYAHKCVEFIREMRLVSPEAEFMMVGYGYSLDVFPKMLEIAGNDIDYVIHRDGRPEWVAQVLPMIREYNQKTGRNIRLVNTEWLSPCGSPEPFDEPGIPQYFDWDGSIHNDYDKGWSRQQISWNYALNGAGRILDYMSYGGEFALANFNNMTNTFGQNLIEAAKDKAWLSCMGEVFAFFHRQFEPCYTATANTGDAAVTALFTRSQDHKEKLYIINRTGTEKEYELPENFNTVCDGLTAPFRSAHVTENFKPVTHILPAIENGRIKLPPLSMVCILKK